jgi:hypothetical protein
LNASWVRRFIANFADKDLVIQPVPVLPGWYVVSLGNCGVKAMNAKYLDGTQDTALGAAGPRKHVRTLTC